MVRDQVLHRGVHDLDVLRAMLVVERDRFVPLALADHAYDDGALPIGADQTIPPAFVVARMAEAAQIRPSDHVLEIGTGSGYAAAVYAHLASVVHTIECCAVLHRHAAGVLDALGYDNVHCVLADGTLGLPSAAPFDVIIVTAADELVPDALLEQLAIGGRLVAPIGPPRDQWLVRVERAAPQRFVREALDPVRFVPLLHGVV